MQVGPTNLAHVEHVYPQNPATGRLADHELWVDRIGNLTLLSSAPNRAISNGGYPVKQPVYAQSGVKITESIATNYGQWGTAEINDRQVKMAALAPGIWQI